MTMLEIREHHLVASAVTMLCIAIFVTIVGILETRRRRKEEKEIK
jgi:hypothetical protein